MTKRFSRKIVAVVMTICLVAGTFLVTQQESRAASGKYWIKVNRKACVVTVYRKSGKKWKPIRAMLCCTGKKSTPTPTGTFRLGAKFRWIHMNTDGWHSYEQYTTRFFGEYYMHSCCYNKPRKNKEYRRQFNALGTHRTHGCIRLCVMDAKWIYENCARGTKVTIYDGKKAGPLGRPKNIKTKKKKGLGWDPTDPNRKNPSFKMYPPRFTFNKATTVEKGSKYDLKSGVKVLNPNALQDITGKLKVKKLVKDGKTVRVSSFSTNNVGTYTVYYYVRDKYMVKSNGKGTTKTFTFKVVEPAPPAEEGGDDASGGTTPGGGQNP